MPEFLEIIGQEKAIARLQRSMAGQRMPHSFLFTGPAGVGRRTTAIALGKTLLCEKPLSQANAGKFPDLEDNFQLKQSCGACNSCKMIEAGTHPDFQLVYKELARYHDDASVRSRVMQELGIPVIRSFLISPSTQSSSQGRGKVFVVLESELLSIPAQNAMLKTLEEPPDGVTIILICTRSEELLPTTRSRCSTISFALLLADFVKGKLVKSGIEAAEADFWAHFTGGSVGRALKLAQQGMYEIKQDVIDRIASPDAQSSENLGDHLAKLADKLATAAVAAAKKLDGADLSKALASRRSTGIMLELIASAFSDAVTIATQTDRPLINSDQSHAVNCLARRFSPTELARVIEQLSSYEKLLWRNVNPKVVWDNVVITCCSAAPLEL